MITLSVGIEQEEGGRRIAGIPELPRGLGLLWLGANRLVAGKRDGGPCQPIPEPLRGRRVGAPPGIRRFFPGD